MKILITGNPTHGIAKSLQQLYPNATFISRSNGYDLHSSEGIEKFKELLASHTVFINHSQLYKNTQIKLLNIASEVWTHGHVINIGSVMEFKKWEWIEPEAAEEKRQLRERSLELSSENFKTTHLIVGGLSKDNWDSMRIHTDRVAETIKWILENDNYIPLMYVDKVSDELINRYRK